MIFRTLFVMYALLASAPLLLAQNHYLGVNNSDIPVSCSVCHSAAVDSWGSTGHAAAQANGAVSDQYGYSCLPCHNTGWDSLNINGGADEYVSAGEDNAYAIVDEDNWNRTKDVQCEACHGPVGNADGSGLADGHTAGGITDYSSENCGVCHQGAHHPYYDQWQQSMHAQGPSGSGTIPVFFNRETRGSCYYCHSAQDFVAFLNDPDYDGATFVPEGEPQDLTCVTCHDPHSGGLRAVLDENGAPVEDAVVCDVCHTAHIEEVDINTTPHHTTSEVLDGSALFGYQYPGETYENSVHTMVAAERCINCHVYPTPFNYATGAAAVTGHTFEPRVESCVECHADYYTVVDTSNHETVFDYRGVQTKIRNLIGTLETKLAAASPADSTTDEFKAALYNLHAAEAEGSYGIHNTGLVEKLLNDAIARFNPTEVERNRIPDLFALAQNYPNPFNPSTILSFSLPQWQQIRLEIFDVKGTLVRTLASGFRVAGEHKLLWDGRDNRGLPVAAGTYIYRLQAESQTLTRKMIYLK